MMYIDILWIWEYNIWIERYLQVKKRTVVLMAMLLCAVSLAACGKDKETDSSPQGEVSVSDTTNDTTEAEKEEEEA